MELYNILQKYKEITVALIKEIKNDGNIDEYLKKREQLLSGLKSNCFNKNELVIIYNELGIEQLEKQAKVELTELRESIKSDMVELKKQKDAAKGYNNYFKNINFINKHI